MAENRHITKARDYLGKGAEFYRKAAVEIQAAHDEGWASAAIGRELGYSAKWVTDIVAWATKPEDTAGAVPWAGPRGEVRESSTAAKVLARSTPEQAKDMLSGLSPADLEKVQLAAQKAAAEKAGKPKPPPILGKPVRAPSGVTLDRAEFDALCSSSEADAEQAMEIVRRGNLSGKAEELREGAIEAADAWRAVASELSTTEGKVAV
jgi:hypothetical protein